MFSRYKYVSFPLTCKHLHRQNISQNNVFENCLSKVMTLKEERMAFGSVFAFPFDLNENVNDESYKVSKIFCRRKVITNAVSIVHTM